MKFPEIILSNNKNDIDILDLRHNHSKYKNLIIKYMRSVCLTLVWDNLEI